MPELGFSGVQGRKERTASEHHHICESGVFCCFALHIPSCWLIADLYCVYYYLHGGIS